MNPSPSQSTITIMLWSNPVPLDGQHCDCDGVQVPIKTFNQVFKHSSESIQKWSQSCSIVICCRADLASGHCGAVHTIRKLLDSQIRIGAITTNIEFLNEAVTVLIDQLTNWTNHVGIQHSPMLTVKTVHVQFRTLACPPLYHASLGGLWCD